MVYILQRYIISLENANSESFFLLGIQAVLDVIHVIVGIEHGECCVGISL